MILGSYATSLMGITALIFMSSAVRGDHGDVNPTIVNPNFDDSRIANNPDQKLLYNIRKYFKTFTDGDAEAMWELQHPEFNITDIPLTIVRLSRNNWYDANKAFTGITNETKVTAISLYGSSDPGKFAIMENQISFRMKETPPPPAAINLPPGIKAGDTAGMIMLSALWWDENGKVIHELEYGRLLWDDWDIDPFFQ